MDKFSQAKLFCSEKPIFVCTLDACGRYSASNGCVNSEIKQTIISSELLAVGPASR